MDKYKKLERKLYEYPSNKLRLYNIEMWLNSYHNKESITIDEYLHYLKQSRLKRELMEQNTRVECLMQLLDPTQKSLIELKYFSNKSIEEISMIMNLSISRIYALKVNMLDAILKEYI